MGLLKLWQFQRRQLRAIYWFPGSELCPVSSFRDWHIQMDAALSKCIIRNVFLPSKDSRMDSTMINTML